MNFLVDLIGVIGLIILLISLIINVKRRTRTQVIRFYALQLLGASLLCFYSLLNEIYLFFILQGTFVLVNAYFIFEKIVESHNSKKKGEKSV